MLVSDLRKGAGHEGPQMDLSFGRACRARPTQQPENKRPKIEQRTAILSMSRVVWVKIIQWENIIKGLSTPHTHFDSIHVRIKQLWKESVGIPTASAMLWEEDNSKTRSWHAAGKGGLVTSQGTNLKNKEGVWEEPKLQRQMETLKFCY